jgi:hypothetical protein
MIRKIIPIFFISFYFKVFDFCVKNNNSLIFRIIKLLFGEKLKKRQLYGIDIF